MRQRDAACDYIRGTAMMTIILCHFFQIRHQYAAFSWLNIGVQVFFVLSAKLLSKKDITTGAQALTFYKTRLLRIFLPVWLYLLCLVPVLFLVGRGPTLSAMLLYTAGLAGFAPSGILGLGHFWYITALLLCYLVTPLLNRIDQVARGASPLKGLLLKTAPVAAAVLIFAMTPLAYFGVNVSLFIIAFFCFRTWNDKPDWSWTLTLRLLPFALAAIGVRLYLDGMAEPNPQLYELGSTAAKAVLGMFLFALLYLLFSRFGEKTAARGITTLSNVSYEVYIVHQFILLALYEYVPFFRGEGALNGLAMLVAALLLIAGNTAVLYTAKIKIECGLRQRLHRE